jgi:hypothetical protein
MAYRRYRHDPPLWKLLYDHMRSELLVLLRFLAFSFLIMFLVWSLLVGLYHTLRSILLFLLTGTL